MFTKFEAYLHIINLPCISIGLYNKSTINILTTTFQITKLSHFKYLSMVK